jgi:phthalate 4,5-dioxygenase oxygenase subunit
MLINQTGHLNRAVTEDENARSFNPYANAGGYVPTTSDPRSRYFTVANKSNDYLIDYEVQKTSQFIGVATGGNLQDRAMTELMTNEAGIEPIYDRSKEHLGRTDSMVIMGRRLFIKAATALRDEGKVPANVDNVVLDSVRSASLILPENANWIEASEQARRAAQELPVVYVVPS